LENEWSKYHQAPAPAINDELPDHSGADKSANLQTSQAPPKAIDTSERDGLPRFLDRRQANGSVGDATEASFVDLVGGR
jgi:hypothetical protein